MTPDQLSTAKTVVTLRVEPLHHNVGGGAMQEGMAVELKKFQVHTAAGAWEIRSDKSAVPGWKAGAGPSSSVRKCCCGSRCCCG